MQPRGVLEQAGQGRVLLLLLVGLRGSAQGAQILEHPLGVAAALGVRGVVALTLVVAHQPAGHRHRRDRDVADRPSRRQLGPDVLQPGAELDQRRPRSAAWVISSRSFARVAAT